MTTNGHKAPGPRAANPFLFIDRATGRTGTLAEWLERGEVQFKKRLPSPDIWGPGEYDACRLVQMLAGLSCLPWTLTPRIAA